MRNSGLTGISEVDLLLTEINTDLAQRPIAPNAAHSRLAWCRKEGKVGQRTIFQLPWFGNAWQKKSIYEQTKGTKPAMVSFDVESDMWGPDGELIPALTRACDIYGIVENNIPTMLAQGAVELDRQFGQLIADGVTTKTLYDGKNFFATDHEANPNKPGMKTFSNYKVGRALDDAGIVATIEDLEDMPGPDGNLLEMPGDLVIFCSTGAQRRTAKTLMNAGLIPSSVGTATQSNVMQGDADVMRLKSLKSKGSGKYWGIAKICTDKHRPFVFDNPIPMFAYVTGLSINDQLNVTMDASIQGVKGAHGFGYLWPQLCVLCVEP